METKLISKFIYLGLLFSLNIFTGAKKPVDIDPFERGDSFVLVPRDNIEAANNVIQCDKCGEVVLESLLKTHEYFEHSRE